MGAPFKLQILSAILCASAAGQTQAGLATDWDIRSQMKRFSDHARSFGPLLAEIRVEPWLKEGASDTYVRQLASAKAELQNVTAAAERFASDPERLTLALEAFFRLQGMEALVESLKAGVQRYQSSELAARLTRLLAEDANLLAALQRHITDLASTREQEIQIMNQEAQRCRALILKQPGQAAESQSRRRTRR